MVRKTGGITFALALVTGAGINEDVFAVGEVTGVRFAGLVSVVWIVGFSIPAALVTGTALRPVGGSGVATGDSISGLVFVLDSGPTLEATLVVATG